MAEDFKIIIDTENPLFNRREIEGEIRADVTPSREEVVQIIAEKFSASPETIKVRTIKGRFGSKDFIIVANIYASKEDKEQTELKSKRDAKQEIKPEVQTEAPAETQATDTTGVHQGGASTSSRPREQGMLYKGQESKEEEKAEQEIKEEPKVEEKIKEESGAEQKVEENKPEEKTE